MHSLLIPQKIRQTGCLLILKRAGEGLVFPFIRLFLDDQSYGTTGNQLETAPSPVQEIAQTSGYRKAYLIDQENEFRKMFSEALAQRDRSLFSSKSVKKLLNLASNPVLIGFLRFGWSNWEDLTGQEFE